MTFSGKAPVFRETGDHDRGRFSAPERPIEMRPFKMR